METCSATQDEEVRRVLILLLVVLLGACRDDEPADPVAERDDDTDEPIIYVAVGASETVGVGAGDPTLAWPEVFRRRALPPGTMFTSLGVSGSTVAAALQQQVARAVDLQPTLVTVWLNVNDLTRFVPPETYESQLRDLVNRLRRGGETAVLVANTPALDRLPAITRFGLDPALVNGAVDAYNRAIERVVRDEGAVLVDLHTASLAARAEGKEAGYISGDGFHPSAAGHEAAAEVFAAAYRASVTAARR